MPNNNDNILDWRLASYGKIIRGGDDTSEDQAAEACEPEVARRLVACWNKCIGISTDDLEAAEIQPCNMAELYLKLKNHCIDDFIKNYRD